MCYSPCRVPLGNVDIPGWNVHSLPEPPCSSILKGLSMTTNEDKITTITSICVILLREVRAERGIHQAMVADWIGKTPSSWTKVEAGKSPLQFETFIRISNAMQISPSYVLAAAERYAALLSQRGWAVLTSELDSREDALLRLAQEYWSSPGCRRASSSILSGLNFSSVLNGPIYNINNTISLAAVFQFVLDPDFRDAQLAESLPFTF